MGCDGVRPEKPRLRGVSHQWAAIFAVPLGGALVIAAEGSRARVAVAVYAISLVALFAVSAVYHRVDWRSVVARRRMRRLDHSMIFVLIAATYTPFAVVAIRGSAGLAILVAAWAGALGGVVVKLVWISAPRRLVVATYVALGWIALVVIPQLVGPIGAVGLALLALGGLLYTVGGVVYALQRPDPAPGVFGYHEVFHAMVIAAALVQYAVIAVWVVPR
jgi:hemolysin III